MNSPRQVLIVTVVVLLAAEVALRIRGDFKVYQEQIGNSYKTDYGAILPTWYFSWTPSQQLTPSNSDFSYPYSINSLGFREREVSATKPDSTVRIIVTGDSFTEGVGAPYDSTWPRLLEKYLIEEECIVQVVDAARSGSDVFYDYVFYRDKLKGVSHEIVLAAVNLTDYQDYIFRGGLGRFKADGKTHYTQPPWYEFFYKHSHLLRAVMMRVNNYPFNGIFVSQKDYVEGWQATSDSIVSALALYDSVAKSNGAKFVVVLHTTPCEILNDGDFTRKNIQNLYDLERKCTSRGITVIQLSDMLREKFSKELPANYTYPHDQHFKPIGYAAMADSVSKALLQMNLLSTQQ